MLRKSAALGNEGEAVAAGYLAERGMRILERNWRNGRDEIDIICEEPDRVSSFSGGRPTLVFVEVKTRTSPDLERASSALDRRKISALVRAARRYIGSRGEWDRACRFDLICVNGEDRRVEHIKDVIDVGNIDFGGNTSWQPW